MFETQIAAGMRLLDEKMPGWIDAINLERLDQRFTKGEQCCVLGQVFGAAEKAVEPLELGSTIGSRARHYGFDAPYKPGSYDEDCYAALTTEWREAIAARRGEA